MEKSKIIERLEYSIDVERFLGVISKFVHLNEQTQIMLTRDSRYSKAIPGADLAHPLQWANGAGSLFNQRLKRYTSKTSDYTHLPSFFVGTYVEEVIENVKKIASPKKIGRVRLLTLLPKTCYSLHIDEEEFRFHIPIQTSHDSFFVSGTTIDRMPEVGQLYTFKTDEEHTAVNASLTEKRIHLVFDTYD